MNYFTRERYLAQQVFDKAAMDAADADWEAAVDRYDAYLQTIRPGLPEPVRQLLEGYYLHDARILSMGRRGDDFFISMQLDPPPNDLLTITYTLAGPLELKKEPFPNEEGSSAVAWLYEEIERVQERDRTYYVHSILFSNGWEARIPVRDVHLETALPVFPHPSSRKQFADSASSAQGR